MELKVVYIDDCNIKILEMTKVVENIIKDFNEKNEPVNLTQLYVKRNFSCTEEVDKITTTANGSKIPMFNSYNREKIGTFNELDLFKDESFNEYNVIFIIDIYLEIEEQTDNANSYYILKGIIAKLLKLGNKINIILQSSVRSLADTDWRSAAGLVAAGTYSNIHFLTYGNIVGDEYTDGNQFKELLIDIINEKRKKQD